MRLDCKAAMGHLFWRGQSLGEAGAYDQEIAEYDFALQLDPQVLPGARRTRQRPQGKGQLHRGHRRPHRGDSS